MEPTRGMSSRSVGVGCRPQNLSPFSAGACAPGCSRDEPIYVHSSGGDGIPFGEHVHGGCLFETSARKQDARQRLKSPVKLDVPKAKDLTVTTYMVQNLPRKTSIFFFTKALDEAGFAGTYDFVYVPSRFGTYQNNGQAFVNFNSPIMGATFQREWHRSKRFGMSGSYMLHVAAAELQGFHANVAKWGAGMKKADRVRSRHCRPLVLRDVGPKVASESTASTSSTSSRPELNSDLSAFSHPPESFMQHHSVSVAAPTVSRLPLPAFLWAYADMDA